MHLNSICAVLTITFLYVTSGNAQNEETVCKCAKSRVEDEEPIVRSPSGTFHGSLMSSRRGNLIYAFRGIRFAKPPIGELRFQPPQLIQYYPLPVNATVDGPACPQPGNWLDEPSEDCLRLNVYSLRLPRNNTRNRLTPVLVYFHAGGFYSVSAQSFLEGPQYLLDHDLTLVTVNYRLGSLGFISTGDEWAPGNLGLKDQVAALRWIQRNIASFGGDPNQVTIVGYSAGSISVTLHMLSPMSRGLFHRAIAMSAASTAQWEVPPHQLHLAEKQALILGCPTNDSEAIISCLKTKDAKELGDSLPQFYEFFYDPVLIWRPVVEPNVGQERFLTDDPKTLIKQGKINSVPLITGISELEFAGQAFDLLQNETFAKDMDDNWNKIAPISFVYERDTQRSAVISQELRKFYLGDRKLIYDNDTAFALGRLYGDALISYGAITFANLMAEHSRSPVYNYKFNYTGAISHHYYPGTNTPIGAVHHDDLLYLFNGSRLFEPIDLQSPHSHMVDKMTTMWSNFAWRGDPNPVGDQPVLDGLNWPVMTSSEHKYLQINTNFSIEEDMFEERLRIWERLFRLNS